MFYYFQLYLLQFSDVIPNYQFLIHYINSIIINLYFIIG